MGYNNLLVDVLFQDEIESVIIIGGGTRVPKIQEILLQAVGK